MYNLDTWLSIAMWLNQSIPAPLGPMAACVLASFNPIVDPGTHGTQYQRQRPIPWDEALA